MGWEANGVIPSVGKTSVEGQRARIFIISTNFIKEPFFLAQYRIDCLSRTSLSLRFKRNVKHRWKAEVPYFVEVSSTNLRNLSLLF